MSCNKKKKFTPRLFLFNLAGSINSSMQWIGTKVNSASCIFLSIFNQCSITKKKCGRGNSSASIVCCFHYSIPNNWIFRARVRKFLFIIFHVRWCVRGTCQQYAMLLLKVFHRRWRQLCICVNNSFSMWMRWDQFEN